MARSISTIYDAIIAEKENHTELDALVPNPDDAQTFLDDLTSTSKVAIWRHWFWVVAVAIHVHELIFDNHKTEVEALSDTLINGTPLWLRDQALAFQNGDTLIFNTTTKTFEYATVQTSLQIVKRAAVVESGGVARLKVAKLSGSVPVPLSASELSTFVTYINQIKFAGTNVAATSLASDKLKIAYDITYDPLILDNTGVLISDGVTKPVEDAINNHIQDLSSGEKFDGVLNLTALTDAIQAASGVIDPVITLAEGRTDAGTFTTINKNYTAEAGYMEIDPAFPLSSQITYIAQT